MRPWRVLMVLAGLAFFIAVATLDAVMAKAASSVRPLVVLWAFVPVPVVFLLVALRHPKMKIPRLLSSVYLGAGAVLTVLVLLGVGWIGSERAIHPVQCNDVPKVSDYPEIQSQIQAVRFQSQDGTDLAAWFVPGRRKATVLLLHGYRCKRDEMLPHASMLHKAGYSVFLFDFRSRGESDGDAVTLGYRERDDVLGAIAYLKSRPDVDGSGFGVLGISQGGATAILAAVATLDIRAVASESAFRSVDSAVSQSFTHFIDLPAFPFAPLTVWMAERRLGIKTEQIVPEREVGKISPRPVFIMHGAADNTISPKDGEAIYAAAREPKEWWLIPGAGHAQGAIKAKDEYERRIVAFFDESLR